MRNILAGYVNLLKTAIGSGILSFPYLFKIYGIIPSIILTCFFGMFTLIGLNIFTTCSLKYDESLNLSTLTSFSYPKASIIVNIAIFIKCLGVLTSYLIVIRQLLPMVLDCIFKVKMNEKVVLSVFLLSISPICYFKRINRLKITSTLGIFAIFYIIMFSIYKYTSQEIIEYESKFNNFSFLWIDNLSKFVFAFTCHMNFFTVLGEIEQNASKKMRIISFMVILSALICYLIFGFTNYSLFGENIRDNVLENYPNDVNSAITRLFYIFVMAFSYPLQVNPCRLYFIHMIHLDNTVYESVLGFFITTIIILLTYSIAISGIELGMIYKLIGATSSTLMCLILPPLFYLNSEVEKKKRFLFFSYFSLALGVFIFGGVIMGVFYKVFVNSFNH